MEDETRREDHDCKPFAKEDLLTFQERERWLRDNLDRERAENLLLLRYLSAQRESDLMRFWRWLIGDVGSRQCGGMLMCSGKGPYCVEQPPTPARWTRLKEQLVFWLAQLSNRFRNKGRA